MLGKFHHRDKNHRGSLRRQDPLLKERAGFLHRAALVAAILPALADRVNPVFSVVLISVVFLEFSGTGTHAGTLRIAGNCRILQD